MSVPLHQLCKLWNKNFVGAFRIVCLGIKRMREYYRERNENEERLLALANMVDVCFMLELIEVLRKEGCKTE
jgi:hypothetical protein